MFGDIERLGANGLTGFGQSVDAREFSLQIGLLLVRQARRDFFEPACR